MDGEVDDPLEAAHALLPAVLEDVEVGELEVLERPPATIPDRNEQLHELDLDAFDFSGRVDEDEIFRRVAVAKMGHGAHVRHAGGRWKLDRLDERLLVEGRGQVLVQVELEPIQRRSFRNLDICPRTKAGDVARAAPGLDQPDREAMVAGVDRQLVPGQHLTVLADAFDPQGTGPGKVAEVELNAVGRVRLPEHRRFVEEEGDGRHSLALDNRVEANEAGEDLARGLQQPDVDGLGTHASGRLGQQLFALGCGPGQRRQVGEPGDADVLLAAEEPPAVDVLDPQDQPVVAGPQIALKRQEQGSARRALFTGGGGEAELVAERLEQFALPDDLANQDEVAGPVAGELADGDRGRIDANPSLDDRTALKPAEEVVVGVGSEEGRAGRQVGAGRRERGHPLFVARPRLRQHARELAPVLVSQAAHLVDDVLEQVAVDACFRTLDHAPDVAPPRRPDASFSEASRADEEQQEVEPDPVASLVHPDLGRYACRGAPDLDDAVRFAVNQQNLGARVRQAPIVPAGVGCPLLPALAHLVASGLGHRVAHLPELPNEGVPLVLARELEEEIAFLSRHEDRDLSQPVGVAPAQPVGSRGRRGCRLAVRLRPAFLRAGSGGGPQAGESHEHRRRGKTGLAARRACCRGSAHGQGAYQSVWP